MPDNAIKTFHLEMLNRADLIPKRGSLNFETAVVNPPDPDLNRQLYQQVGSMWQWTDRLTWDDHQWNEYVTRSSLNTWVGYWRGERAGYFELESQHNGNVEIMYFGLLPEYIGLGLGGIMLTAAIESAWLNPGTRRVWVHTCTNDHKHALENYLQRGFQLFKTETE